MAVFAGMAQAQTQMAQFQTHLANVMLELVEAQTRTENRIAEMQEQNEERFAALGVNAPPSTFTVPELTSKSRVKELFPLSVIVPVPVFVSAIVPVPVLWSWITPW